MILFSIEITVLLNFVHIVKSTPLQDYNPEINDQFENATEQGIVIDNNTNKHLNSNIIEDTEILDKDLEKPEPNPNKTVISVLYKIISMPIIKIISSEKIKSVLKNIGTCIVNGVMEIVSFYFPAPLIPLIASAAGMIIPFEPVVMLRRRMPVTSYRRAIKTAVNGFLNTFNDYKFDNYDEDPYMTRRFNRKFMNDDVKKDSNKKNFN